MNEPRRPRGVESLEADVTLARDGDRAALERLIRAVQRDVYSIAIRFLWHPQDAEDASQEILVRIVTGLADFRGDSAFRTWVYRVACNTLLNLRRQRMEERTVTVEEFGDDLERGLQAETEAEQDAPAHALLLEEVKVGCTLAMLLCLDRDHRMAYILGEILELNHHEAAEVLAIEPAAFRKRVSRARSCIVGLMSQHCGLVERTNACRCAKKVANAVALGRVNPQQLLFASSAEQARAFPQVLGEIRRLEHARRAAALYRSHHHGEGSERIVLWMRQLFDAPGAHGSPP
jgi:RNA polymerase sigma factor (sigma-70 family)